MTAGVDPDRLKRPTYGSQNCESIVVSNFKDFSSYDINIEILVANNAISASYR